MSIRSLRLPRLPIHFLNRTALHGIASLLGVPLRIDSATASLKRPSLARIQVEIDVLKDDRVWIGIGECAILLYPLLAYGSFTDPLSCA